MYRALGHAVLGIIGVTLITRHTREDRDVIMVRGPQIQIVRRRLREMQQGSRRWHVVGEGFLQARRIGVPEDAQAGVRRSQHMPFDDVSLVLQIKVKVVE